MTRSHLKANLWMIVFALIVYGLPVATLLLSAK
jgi:hypothetical protein